jgi:hypothetical protein
VRVITTDDASPVFGDVWVIVVPSDDWAIGTGVKSAQA